MNTVQLVPVDLRESDIRGKARISKPIFDTFLESGHEAVKVDMEGMTQSPTGLYIVLNGYARNHRLPVRVFMRAGEVYLQRVRIGDGGDSNSEGDGDGA